MAHPETRTRIITLTARAPVEIVEANWPVIARADGDSYPKSACCSDYSARRGGGELDIYILRVRRHADGRVIVYGVLDAATAWTGSVDRRGGELLGKDDETAAAVRRVGEDCQLPETVIRECIASLPAEVLR